ncbi:MAG: peptidylprolyl isomerase [Pseudomonadota bacterium]
MMKLLSVFILMLCVLAVPPALAERSMRIAAVVNADAITESDVEDRLRLILASSGLPNTKEIRDKALPQVINSLIEEMLMLQEAKRNEIEVSKEELDAGFAEIAQQNNMPAEQFEEMMSRGSIPKKTLMQQIEAQLSWTKIVQSVLRPRVNVKDTDVDVRLERLKNNIGRTEYLVSEIFLPIDKAEDESDARKLANQLVQELNAQKAPFSGVARQFSKAAGAEKGGSLGWVQKGQLADELDDSLGNMSVGSISNPIRTTAGLHILNLREERIIEERIIPGRNALINQIGMERLDRLQRRTMQDLKAEAFIDRRV